MYSAIALSVESERLRLMRSESKAMMKILSQQKTILSAVCKIDDWLNAEM